jgi:VIT1/CCC1 family predicted Fe2+/Mn2+ transporter
VQTACFLLGIAGLVITGCGAAVSAVTGRGVQFWVVQAIGILVADAFIFYFFGWLFE